VFKHPEECIETDGLLGSLKDRNEGYT